MWAINIVDCEWDDWINGTCSVTCGGGVQTNTRTWLTEGQNGGANCTGASTVTEGCNTFECPGNKDSISNWLLLAISRTLRGLSDMGVIDV